MITRTRASCPCYAYKILKWVGRFGLYSLSALIVTLLLINYLFFEQTIRFIADRVESETGRVTSKQIKYIPRSWVALAPSSVFLSSAFGSGAEATRLRTTHRHSMLHLTKKKVLRYVLLPNVFLFIGLAIYFPGSELPIALTLASGIQRASLQERIDACEAKAIEGTTFTQDEIDFLHDLYTCLYKGARLTLILPEVSRMMEHYLSKSGEALEVDASIFNTNDKVLQQMETLRATMLADRLLLTEYRSEVFYMPDFSNIDSVFGLYYGYLIARPAREGDTVQVDWRAEVPWEWPSYASLQEKHGDPRAESFPIPNISCLFRGLDGAIYLDNGLGEYLTHLDIAKSFVAFAEWDEVIKR